MDSNITLICGGDQRMLKVAKLFSKSGECKVLYNKHANTKELSDPPFSALSGGVRIILPIPAFDKNGILNGTTDVTPQKLFNALPSRSVIYGGKLSKLIRHLANEFGHTVYDYGENESFNIYNAIPTAEAAIMLTMELSRSTIYNGVYAVIGYGRIGKALAKRLKKLSATVYVISRNELSLTMAECNGHIPVNLQSVYDSPPKCNVCFNTVPSILFTKKDIESWNCDHFMELASNPGALDMESIKYLGNRYVSALSLPGKHFPDTSGEIIYKTIINMERSGGK